MHQSVRGPVWPEIVLLLAISIMAAWVVNVARPVPLPWWGDFAAKKVEETARTGLAVLSPKEALEIFKAQSALFVDAREPDEFAQEHIPGAMHISAEALLTGLDAAVSGLAKDKPMVLYCSNLACPKSKDLAQGMKEMGFTALSVMPEGLEGWKAEGGPVEER